MNKVLVKKGNKHIDNSYSTNNDLIDLFHQYFPHAKKASQMIP